MLSASPVHDSLDAFVDATPVQRDRYVDLLRVASIGVVVLWHWVFSISHWQGGRLTMPNPIGDVPLLWAATWVLQVMPVFFFVGGYANGASWEAVRREDADWTTFARRRLSRLYRPVAAFIVVWAGFELVAHLVWPAYPGVVHYGMVVFVPLWFLGVYTGITLLTPLTHRVHERWHFGGIAVLAATILAGEFCRLQLGMAAWALPGSALVWVFAHQLGYFYRDGTLERLGRRGQTAVAAGGLGALAVMTTWGPYSHSMVAVRGEATSNMLPTSACIAALAVFQVGLAMLIRPAASRWLARRRVWRRVVTANAVAMTVFLWHMTAVLIVIGLAKLAGFPLATQPTARWWLERPIWLIAPGLVLAVAIAAFSPFELPKTGAQTSRPPA